MKFYVRMTPSKINMSKSGTGDKRVRHALAGKATGVDVYGSYLDAETKSGSGSRALMP